MNGYIVRADYYPDGNIIPLGITDLSGATSYIDRICSIEKEVCKEGQVSYKFLCLSNKKKLMLIFENNKWNCSFIEE